MSDDPLLQPFQLRGLTLRNRLMSTAHEPAYTDDGMPKTRYRLYHAEKARGGIALTMIGGSSVVAPDSPQAFGNILLYKDECVRWLKELADDVHDKGAAVMIQITHLGRRTSWSKDDWLPVIAPFPCARARPSRLPQGDGGLGHRPRDRRLRRRGRAGEGRRARWRRIRVLRPSHRPVLVAGHQQARGRIWRVDRQPPALRHGGVRGGAAARRSRFPHRRAARLRRGLGAGLEPRRGHGDRAPPDPLGVDRLSQRDPRPYRQRRGAEPRDPGHGRALGPAPRLRRRSARRDPPADLSRRPHPGRRDRAPRDCERQARHGRHDPRAYGRSAHRAQDRRGARSRDPPLRRHGLLHRLRSMPARPSASTTRRPAARRRSPIVVPRSDGPKRKVVVVGAGPGGLEAARVAGERGHDVVVLEAAAKPGGQIVLAAALKRRREIMGVVDWRVRECERLGVAFRFNALRAAPTTCSRSSRTSSSSPPAARRTSSSSTSAASSR